MTTLRRLIVVSMLATLAALAPPVSAARASIPHGASSGARVVLLPRGNSWDLDIRDGNSWDGASRSGNGSAGYSLHGVSWD